MPCPDCDSERGCQREYVVDEKVEKITANLDGQLLPAIRTSRIGYYLCHPAFLHGGVLAKKVHDSEMTETEILQPTEVVPEHLPPLTLATVH